MYNVCLFSALGSIVVFCLYDIGRYKEGYIVFALCIIQVTTVTLCFVFVPKVRNYTIHSSLIRRLSKICYYLGKGKVTESFWRASRSSISSFFFCFLFYIFFERNIRLINNFITLSIMLPKYTKTNKAHQTRIICFQLQGLTLKFKDFF